MLKSAGKSIKISTVLILILITLLSFSLPLKAAGPGESDWKSEPVPDQMETDRAPDTVEDGWNELEFEPGVPFLDFELSDSRCHEIGIQSSTATLFEYGFEGSFPGVWGVASSGPGWGQTTYRAHSGSRSVWCAGSSLNPAGSNHPYNANAWMAVGPFDLRKTTGGALSIFASVKTQQVTNNNTSMGDILIIMAATSASDTGAGYYTSGQRPDWIGTSFDLTKWTKYGNLCGRSSVYFLFGFVANGDGTTDKGVFLDYIKITAQVPTPPIAPSGLQAKAISSKQVILTWEDNSVDETGFEIERMNEGTSSFKRIARTKADVTTFEDKSGLTAQTHYLYRIRAVNAEGNSNYCAEAETTTLTEPPSPPALNLPKKGSKGLGLEPVLSWKEPQKGLAESYHVQIGFDNKLTDPVVDDYVFDTFYEVPVETLEWNARYYWRVAARNNEGSNSDWSSVFDFKTASGPPPEAPAMLDGEALSSKQVKLTWWDNSEDETGFYIERKKAADTKFKQIKKVGADIEEYIDKSGLSADTAYEYRIRAYNAGGNSEYSEIISVQTLPNPPGAPKITLPANSAVTDDLNPVLAWNEPNKGKVFCYQIQVALDSKFTDMVIDDDLVFYTTYEIYGGLDWNTKYYWRVRAVDEFDQFSPWATRNFKTPRGE